MRNISKFLSLVAGASLLLSVNSCKEDFLEVEYTDILPADFIGSSDQEAENGIFGCYKMMLPSSQAGDWGLKPNLFLGCHPTMDTQATGWDVDWCKQNWGPESPELGQAWAHVYHAISRCNDYLKVLEDSENISAQTKKNLTAEAKALRGFFYHWLAQAFGKVPMLGTGENYTTSPTKANAATDEEMWNFIIKDLEEAAADLDWTPRNGDYGRCTKGMALTYLADSYMWKAVRCNDNSLYSKAKEIYQQIIDSKTYELQHSFSTLFEPNTTFWNKEAIWEECLDERDSYANGEYGSFMHLKWFTGCKATGGWGTLFLSWEWYLCYENGDKRRDASAMVGPVDKLKTDFPDAVSDYCYGMNPFVFDTVKSELAHHYQYKEESGWAPSVWSMKYWREPLSWSCNQPHAHIYYMRYANVLLNYAECCFRTNDEDKGWDAINQIRNRAWGNLEADCQNKKYTEYYLFKYKQANGDAKNPEQVAKAAAATKWCEDNNYAYPIPFNTTTVAVPDAKTYYTKYAADKGFKSEVWKVACGTEYRKEFNAEWCLCPALVRMGFIEDHINTNYPMNMNPNGDPDNWHTQRDKAFNPERMLMPIPSDEIKRNPECKQNAAYAN